MKNKKNIIKNILCFVLGGIVFGTIGVYAATTLLSQSVYYNNTTSGASSTNVQGALDELYAKSKTCVELHGDYIIETINGSGTIKFLSDYYSGLMPDYIFIDGKSITIDNSYNFATGGNHTIILKWNDSSNLIDLSSMFRGCSSLTSLDLSNLDTSSVTDMNSMFSGCSSLTSLDLSNLDTSSVENMNSMFSDCSSLTSLDLSNWETSNVVVMNSMFSGCSSLTSLDLSNWETSQVMGMYNVIYGHASGLQIKADSLTCNQIASNSGNTGNYTCTQ